MRYCLLGKKLGHSYSQEIHTLSGLDYTLQEREESELKDFLSEGYDGFNVTIPYKKTIIPYLYKISETAAKIGAVNTVIKTEKGYFGDNTDIFGMQYAFERKGVCLRGKKVMILGTGGAGVTAKVLCELKGARSVTVSRSGDINYQNCYDQQDTQIIINATPVGMYPNINDSPVNLERFKGLEFVFDCIYNPYLTQLLKQAKALNVPYSDGLTMLVYQAIQAQRAWGVEKVLNAESVIEGLYRKKINVVLCGMPSSGKSSVGKVIAEKLGRSFIDTDRVITEMTGKTPSRIITESGESAFRDIETQAISKIACKNSCVIATGGGAVLRKENVDMLHLNGVIFHIDRALSLLSDEDRPLSKKESLNALYNKRRKFYENARDYAVANDKSVTDCAEKIIDIFCKINFNQHV